MLSCIKITNLKSQQSLYYWQRNAPSSTAEVDYLIQSGEKIIPIEVKSGVGKTLRSLRLFLETHPKSNFGIRFSTQNYSEHEKVQSFPLYAIAAINKIFKRV